MGDSQPRFKNQVEIAVNFIHREFHGTVRNSRHVYILAENRYSFGLEKSTGSLFLVVCSAKQQHKMAMNNKGKHARLLHMCMSGTYMQKWCMCLACALVTYL